MPLGRPDGWACGGALIAALALCGTAEAARADWSKVGDFAAPTSMRPQRSGRRRARVRRPSSRGGYAWPGATAATLDTPFLDLTSIVEAVSERGLLSAAFAPDYAATGRFYVYLTAKAGAATTGTAGEIQVREYRRSAANPDVADPEKGPVAAVDPPRPGGQPQRRPAPVRAGREAVARHRRRWGRERPVRPRAESASLLGKLIRLDPAAPTPEIVPVGLRNPWRFSFDRVTGTLFVGDVGQNAYEEINMGLAPNYGWSCREGAHGGPGPACSGPVAEPVLELAQSAGNCSVIGGYVVRDPGLPTLVGRYLYTDFCKGELRSFDIANPATDASIGLTVESATSFGEDSCGRLLVASGAGGVYRLVDGAPSACVSTAPPATVVPPADAQPCAVAARVTGVRSVRRLRRLSIALRVDEACNATVSARVKGVATFRTARGSVAAGTRTVLRLRLTPRGGRAVRAALRRHRSLSVALRVQAVDGAGNVRTLTRSVRVRG